MENKVKFKLGTGKGVGRLIKENEATVIVKLKNGRKIKRHKIKHEVEIC
jgi:hypothetical protein